MYKLEDKEFDFKTVTVKDALAIKTAIGVMAKANASADDALYADGVISRLAIKYLILKVNGKEIEGEVTEDLLSATFSNEFAIVEIIAKFQERISGFMQLLPSFQTAKNTKSKVN